MTEDLLVECTKFQRNIGNTKNASIKKAKERSTSFLHATQRGEAENC